MTFDYKKYSLENLENWVQDALFSAEATPQEIYDVIKNVVDENYHIYKLHTSRCYELLALLNGNGKNHIEAYDDVMREKEYYEPSMPPWGHSDMEALQYTEEELNAMCDKAKLEQKKTPSHDNSVTTDWSMSDDGFWIPSQETSKKKWILTVEKKPEDFDYYVLFPDDLLEAANLKEGDQIEWVNNGDGSYTLHKVTEPLNIDEC